MCQSIRLECTSENTLHLAQLRNFLLVLPYCDRTSTTKCARPFACLFPSNLQKLDIGQFVRRLSQQPASSEIRSTTCSVWFRTLRNPYYGQSSSDQIEWTESKGYVGWGWKVMYGKLGLRYVLSYLQLSRGYLSLFYRISAIEWNRISRKKIEKKSISCHWETVFQFATLMVLV